MKNKTIIPIVITAAVVGVASFIGGMKYSESKQKTQQVGSIQRGGMSGGVNGQNRIMGGRNASGGVVFGDILNADDVSITVKLQDGSSKIVLLSDKTTIGKMSSGTKSDLKTGEQVSAFGTQNSDGSVTATNIQLGIQFGGMRGR